MSGLYCSAAAVDTALDVQLVYVWARLMPRHPFVLSSIHTAMSIPVLGVLTQTVVHTKNIIPVIPGRNVSFADLDNTAI